MKFQNAVILWFLVIVCPLFGFLVILCVAPHSFSPKRRLGDDLGAKTKLKPPLGKPPSVPLLKNARHDKKYGDKVLSSVPNAHV